MTTCSTPSCSPAATPSASAGCGSMVRMLDGQPRSKHRADGRDDRGLSCRTILGASGGRVWYNRRGLQPLPIETHEVAIGGWYPDLLYLGQDDRVWAIEAKRDGGDLAR